MWSLGSERFDDDFPLLWRIGVNAWVGIGQRELFKEMAVVQISLDLAIDKSISEHCAQTTVNDAIYAAGFESLCLGLVL